MIVRSIYVRRNDPTRGNKARVLPRGGFVIFVISRLVAVAEDSLRKEREKDRKGEREKEKESESESERAIRREKRRILNLLKRILPWRAPIARGGFSTGDGSLLCCGSFVKKPGERKDIQATRCSRRIINSAAYR